MHINIWFNIKIAIKMSNVHKEYDQAEKDLEVLKINEYKLKRHQFVGDTHYYKC